MGKKKRKDVKSHGGAGRGQGRKPSPHSMPPENAIKLHLPNDLYAFLSGMAHAAGKSRQDVIRDMIKASLESLRRDK